MGSKKVILTRSNILKYDYRMPKEIKLLKNEGYSVTLLLWDQYCETLDSSKNINATDYEEIHLKLKSPAFGFKKIPFFPFWWLFEFYNLIRNEWDIVHVINFDSIIPALLAAKVKGKKVIYEILEPCEDSVILPRRIRNFFIYIDKIVMRFVNGVVLADESQIKEFDGIPNKNLVIIYDSPQISPKIVENKKNDLFTIFYVGLLYNSRHLNLDKIISAIREVNDIKLIIAGYGDMVEEIEKFSKESPNKIHYIGKISHKDAIQQSMSADLLFEIRNPVRLDNKYTCGSKFLRAIACGKPFLANKGTSTAEKVVKENCGISVDAMNIDEIKDAIIMFRDNPKLCLESGENGRKAFEERYCWEVMESRLIALYKKLMT